MSLNSQLKDWMDQNRKKVKEDLFQFLRFQSISTDPAYCGEVLKCAEWLKTYIQKHTAMKTELIQTAGYPLVYAENLSADSSAPTLLIYGHYDVQPIDPIEEWRSDPFQPAEREGQIYARGAVDDKGQIFYALIAMRAFRELGYQLPINLKFCIEGEEEAASIGLSKSLPNLEEKLKADSLLVIDFDQFDRKHGALTLGARGIAAFEVILQGSNGDLHSGMHGGMAYNPNRALVELLAKVWDEEGRVQIEGFYDDVIETSGEEFAFRFNEEMLQRDFGIETIGGEKGRSLIENNYFRPTFEINGISGGYTGIGFKTVIPAHAVAKISCRLVPNQNPDKIAKQVAKFLKDNVVKGMKIEVKNLGGEKAFRGRVDSNLAKAVSLAASDVMGSPCKKVMSGGSIPIIAQMVEMLDLEVAGMGYGLPSDNIHAPNEHFEWNRFENGFLTVARILELL